MQFPACNDLRRRALHVIGHGRSDSTWQPPVLRSAAVMDVGESRSGQTLVLEPRGRLDGRSTPAFEQRLLGCIEAGERAVLLDCGKLDYISSAGLRVVLRASKRLNALDGWFALCTLNANVREVFRISGFDTIMTIHPDAAAALATFS